MERGLGSGVQGNLRIVNERVEQPGVAAVSARCLVDCGDLPFVIRRDGTWLYKGSPITRKPMVCLFSTVLTRDEEAAICWRRRRSAGGSRSRMRRLWPWRWIGRAMAGAGAVLSHQFDKCVTAGPEHPIRIAHDLLSCEPTPYLRVRDGKGRFPIEARINRATIMSWWRWPSRGCCAGAQVLGVWSEGMFFSLGDLPHCSKLDCCLGSEPMNAAGLRRSCRRGWRMRASLAPAPAGGGAGGAGAGARRVADRRGGGDAEPCGAGVFSGREDRAGG